MKIKLKYWIIALFALFFGCVENRSPKERILQRIALAYIEINENDIRNSESSRRERGLREVPMVVKVQQKENYRGYSVFLLLYNVGVADSLSFAERQELSEEKLFFREEIMPSKLIKAGSRYIAMYLNGRPSISKEDIPPYALLNDWGSFLGGIEWVVLMCDNCNNFIIIGNVGLDILELIVQINDFTCDCKRIINPRRVKIKAEDAIIDPVKMKEFRPPPPPPLEGDFLFQRQVQRQQKYLLQ
jgi:hypothetical protein